MAKKNWIKGALKHHHKGSLHRELHVPLGEKLPLPFLRLAAHAPGKVGQRARFALSMRKMQTKRKRRRAKHKSTR